MANNLEKTVRAYIHGSNISKRYIRVEEATGWLSEVYTNIYTKDDKDIGENSYTDIEYTKMLAIAAGALYRMQRIELIHKERLDDFMKHLYKVPGTNKQVVKKFVRIGEGSIIYSIGHHRFIEMARAAGATYKINEGTGGTVLINLEVFDEYMEQFRQNPVPMKHPLFVEKEEGEQMGYSYKTYSDTKDVMKKQSFITKEGVVNTVCGSSVTPEGDYTFMCTGRYRGLEDRRTPTQHQLCNKKEVTKWYGQC